MQDFHSLLKRQLKKHFGLVNMPEPWPQLIHDINAAYREFDEDRKMLERALDLSSQELLQANAGMRTILQAIPDALFILDEDGKILECKASGGDNLTFSSQELVGKYVDTLQSPKLAGEKFGAAIALVRQKREMVTFEYSLIVKNRKKYYEARLKPVHEKQMIAIIRNITARKLAEEGLKESEEKYRTLVDNLNVGIYRVTNDYLGHFAQANPAMAKMFGYSSLDEFLGVSITELYRNLDDRVVFLEEMKERGYVKERVLLMKRKDGAPIEISCTAITHYDDNGHPLWIEGVMEDVTERKQREQEILKTSKLESIGILAGGIAHDFNNILTAIIGNISLARTMIGTDSEIAMRLLDAENASLRARDLTRQLLTFSKGGAPVKKISSVSDLLKESVRFVLAGSNVRCKFHVADDLLPADIDQGQINQVINNLVINAKQAMPNGGIVSIYAENIIVGGIYGEKKLPLPEGTYIKITIEDEGAGISEEHLAKIFDPYFTTKKTGTGLGLTTSYAIIKKHGGHIVVRSRIGVGTSFAVYLPASQGATVEQKETKSALSPGKGRILFMDDEEIVRIVVQGMLDHLGYTITLAKDGNEAIACVKDAAEHGEHFDAVIMDLTVPGGMGGKDAVPLLKAIDGSVKLIATSGYSDDPIMSDYKNYGFAGIIPKPVTLEDIREVLSIVLADK